MVSSAWILLGMGCMDAIMAPEEWEQEAWLSTSSELIEAPAQDVRRLEDFLVPQPWYADSVSASTVSKCLAGEDVRAYIASSYAVMEIETGAIKVGDQQATWLEDGAAPTYDQANGRILSLYEALLNLRGQSRLLSGACFPPTEGKLLVVLPAQVPAPLAWQALSTAVDAGFDEIYLMVSDPVAELSAESAPPRPRFKPGTLVAPVRGPALSPKALADARAQLAAGRLVDEKGEGCKPSARVDLPQAGGTLTLTTLDGPGGSQTAQQVALSTLKATLGQGVEELWLVPQKDSKAGEMVALLTALDTQELPAKMQVLAAEDVDFMTWKGGSQVIDIDPYWSAHSDYESRSSETWVSVIPLEMSRRNSGPCVESTSDP